MTNTILKEDFVVQDKQAEQDLPHNTIAKLMLEGSLLPSFHIE